jgi:hypothetical protein
LESIAKAFWSIVLALLALIPTWLYIGLGHILNPIGFWEKIVFLIVGIYFVPVQFILLIILGVLLYLIWIWDL